MTTLLCVVCHKSYEVRPYRAETSKYCSPICRFKGQLGRSPTNKGKFVSQIHLTCQYCRKDFVRSETRIKWGRGKFCSPECQYASMRERPKKNRVVLNCLNCGREFSLHASELKSKKGAGKYCSRSCRDSHRIGKNNPQYINGSAQEKYGPNWQSQKREAKRRDNFSCVDCEITEEQSIQKYGQALQVHHKKPFRLFDSYIEANDLSNLETLCCHCHRSKESLLQRIERVLHIWDTK
jgi:5-methylcytosine-specific restriction endonuclease McrA